MSRIRKLRNPAFFLLSLGLLFAYSESFACAAIPNSSVSTCPIQNASGNYQIFGAIFCLVQYHLTLALATMYTSIVTAAAPVIQTILIIYMSLLGYAFMIGMAGAEPKEFFIRMIKLILVLVLTSSTNQCAFFTYIYQFFISMQGLATLALPGASPGGVFNNLDAILTAQKNSLTQAGAVIIAFLFIGPGVIVSTMLSLGFLFMIKAMFSAFKTLALSIVALTMALLFAPVFLCFMLFGETKDMFDSWLHNVVSYAIQPIIIFFYLILAAPFLDLSYVFNQLVGNLSAVPPVPVPSPPVIIQHTYTFNYLIGSLNINSFALAPTASFNSVVSISPPFCVPQPAAGTPCPAQNIGILLAALMYSFEWLLMAIATCAFMKEVPDLATRLSHIGQPLFTPRLGGTQSSEGGSISREGLIMPGFTSGYGGDAVSRNITRPAMRALEKVRIGPRLLQIAPSMIRPDLGKMAAQDRINELKEALKTHASRGEIEDIIGLAVDNKNATDAQVKEVQDMINKNGRSDLTKVYDAAYAKREGKAAVRGIEDAFNKKEETRKNVLNNLEKELTTKGSINSGRAMNLMEKAARSEYVTTEEMGRIEDLVRQTGDKALMDAYTDTHIEHRSGPASTGKLQKLIEDASQNKYVTDKQMEYIGRLARKSGNNDLINSFEAANRDRKQAKVIVQQLENGLANIKPGNIESTRKLLERAMENPNVTAEQREKIGKMVMRSGSKSLIDTYEKIIQSETIAKDIEKLLKKNVPGNIEKAKTLIKAAAKNKYITREAFNSMESTIRDSGDKDLIRTYEEEKLAMTPAVKTAPLKTERPKSRESNIGGEQPEYSQEKIERPEFRENDMDREQPEPERNEPMTFEDLNKSFDALDRDVGAAFNEFQKTHAESLNQTIHEGTTPKERALIDKHRKIADRLFKLQTQARKARDSTDAQGKSNYTAQGESRYTLTESNKVLRSEFREIKREIKGEK